jgi:hypothetical protein
MMCVEQNLTSAEYGLTTNSIKDSNNILVEKFLNGKVPKIS